MTINNNVKAKALQLLAGEPTDNVLNNTLRWFCKWRSAMVARRLIQHEGLQVQNGPFKGMTFLDRSQEGCHIPKLLGCYEQPLHADLVRLAQNDYDTLLNIGSAEGYYTVGLARLFPNATIVACDTNPKAVDACKKLAELNGVSNISFHLEFKPSDFATFVGRRTLVVCDIEGGEKTLLDPNLAPELKTMDIIVESHECFLPGLTQDLAHRFSQSHQVKSIEDDGLRQLSELPDWFKRMPNLDQLMCIWEWRSGPTPWLVMEVKNAK